MSERRRTSRTAASAQSSSDIDGLPSRPTSSILGKNTAVLKTSVPDEVADRLERIARELGYRDGAEFRREAFIVLAFGEEELLDLHLQRIRALGRKLAGFTTGMVTR